MRVFINFIWGKYIKRWLGPIIQNRTGGFSLSGTGSHPFTMQNTMDDFPKTISGHNLWLWLECPTKVMSTQLSYNLKGILFSGIPHLPIVFALQVARWQVVGGTKKPFTLYLGNIGFCLFSAVSPHQYVTLLFTPWSHWIKIWDLCYKILIQG